MAKCHQVFHLLNSVKHTVINEICSTICNILASFTSVYRFLGEIGTKDLPYLLLEFVIGDSYLVISTLLFSKGKASLFALTGELKKSEGSQLPASGSSKCAGNPETSLLEMLTSISVSEALNESHSSSFTGRSVLQEVRIQ